MEAIAPFIQRFDPHTNHRVPLLVLFYDNYFRPKILLIFTYFQRGGGGLSRKKAIFSTNLSKMCPKTPFLTVFFSKNCLRLRKCCQNKVFIVLGVARKIYMIYQKKIDETHVKQLGTSLKIGTSKYRWIFDENFRGSFFHFSITFLLNTNLNK